MVMKTQGTNFFIIDTEATGGPVVMSLTCPTNIDGISATRDQLETTCLDSPARTYEPGLATPGTMTVAINFDPKEDTHSRLIEMWKSGLVTDMAIGYSDGSSVPDIGSDGSFDFPTDRSFLLLPQSYIADMPQTIALNAVVTSNVSIQLSGYPEVFKKVA